VTAILADYGIFNLGVWVIPILVIGFGVRLYIWYRARR
jgi:hypothetical protein